MEESSIVTIIAAIIIGLGIALFVRYGIRPKIETVYQTNRNLRIGGLLIGVNTISRQFDNTHRIFEEQQNFVYGEERAFNLTVNQVEALRMFSRNSEGEFNRIRSRIDFLLFHLEIRELENILNFLANTFSYYTIPQGAQPNQNGLIQVIYLGFRVDIMRRFGWELINMFPYTINYDFILRMRRYDELGGLE